MDVSEQPSQSNVVPPPVDDRTAALPPLAPTHTISGTITVEDFSPLATDVIAEANGYPVLSLAPEDTVGVASARVDFLGAIMSGTRFDCSSGLGGGYQDLAEGANITVTDGTGAVIAVGTLGSGVMDGAGCHLGYRIQVPETEFYRITVSHRGTLSYSRDQLHSSGWSVSSEV